MQRKAIRAVVGGSDRDIPIHTFTPNQFVFYDGTAIFTQVAVTPVGTPTPGHLAAWFTTSSIVDSGVVLGDVVTNPGTSVVNQLATFRDSTGKTIQAVTATVVGGAFTNVTTINTRNADDFITGPASATSGDILTFNGTTGKAAQDSGVLATNIVTTTSTPSSSQIATFTGTGKAIQNSAITITSGSLFSVVNINSRPVDSFITGPSSAVNGNLPSFSGTTGRDTVDSGVSVTNVVTAASATANKVATFTGTGKAIQAVTVAISGGAISSVTTINGTDPSTWVVGPASATSGNIATYNGTTGKLIQDSGVSATAHASRHLPGGADSLFETGTNWGAADIPVNTSTGSVLRAMLFRTAFCGGLTLSTSYQTPSNATLSLSTARASDDYIVEWNFVIDVADSTTGSIDVAINFPASGLGTAIVTLAGATQYLSSGLSGSGNLGVSGVASFSLSGAPTGIYRLFITGAFLDVAANANVAVQIKKSAGTGILVAYGTCFAATATADV